MTKTVSVIILVLLTGFAFSQKSEKKELKKFVSTFFEALHEKDTAFLASQFKDGTVLSSVFVTDGKSVLFSSDVNGFLENIYAFKEHEMEEVVKKMKIHIDGDLAHLWMDYKFYFNNELQHTGSNSFSMVKEDGKWLIRDLIDTYYPVEKNKKGGQ